MDEIWRSQVLKLRLWLYVSITFTSISSCSRLSAYVHGLANTECDSHYIMMSHLPFRIKHNVLPLRSFTLCGPHILSPPCDNSFASGRLRAIALGNCIPLLQCSAIIQGWSIGIVSVVVSALKLMFGSIATFSLDLQYKVPCHLPLLRLHFHSLFLFLLAFSQCPQSSCPTITP
jgi:hypothetical protein